MRVSPRISGDRQRLIETSIRSNRNDYERRCLALLASLSSRTTYLTTTALPPTYPDVRALATSFAEYKKSEKRTWVVERQELSDLFSNIQNKLRTYGMLPFKPREGCEVEALDRCWEVLLGAEEKWSRGINKKIRESVATRPLLLALPIDLLAFP